MDFPRPREDPVTRITLASSATILRRVALLLEDDRGVSKLAYLAGAKDEALTKRIKRRGKMDINFMVDFSTRAM